MALFEMANCSVSQMESTLIEEALQPILMKHFENFSASQWCRLAAQNYDSCVTASLADLVTEIVQTLAAIVLRRMNPEKGWNKKAVDAALKDLNKLQGDFFSTEFANALKVHVEKCERAEELTALVRNEVSEKVQSIASNAINCSALPMKPAVFVSGSMSSTQTLHKMVQCAGQCLSTLNLQGFCYWEKEKILNPETEKLDSRRSLKANMSATEAVTDILSKWASASSDMSSDKTISDEQALSLDHTISDEPDIGSDRLTLVQTDVGTRKTGSYESGLSSVETSSDVPDISLNETISDEADISSVGMSPQKAVARANDRSSNKRDVKPDKTIVLSVKLGSDTADLRSERTISDESDVCSNHTISDETEVRSDKTISDESDVCSIKTILEEPEFRSYITISDEADVKSDKTIAKEPDVRSDKTISDDMDFKSDKTISDELDFRSERNHRAIAQRSVTIRRRSGGDPGRYGEDFMDIKTFLAAQDAAFDIVSDIWSNLPPEDKLSVEGKGTKSCLYALSTFQKVKAFFDSKAKPFGNVTHASQVLNNNIFPTFVENLFDKMMADLKAALKEEYSPFLLPQQDFRESQCVYILPRPYSPQHSSPTADGRSRMTRMTVRSRRSSNNSEPPIMVETIKRLQRLKSSDEVIELSRELVERIYDQLTPEDTYPLPFGANGPSLFDSVISDLMMTLDHTQTYFAPDVLYAMTEDAVGKFMQQVQLWMVNRSSEKAHRNEAVAGAVAEIEELIPSIVTTSAESSSSAQSVRMGHSSDEKCCPEEVMNRIVTSFCERLITKLMKPIKLSANTIYIIKRLSYMVQEGMSFSYSALQKLDRNMAKVTTAIIKNLHLEFDSEQKLLDAVVSHDTAFDDAVIKCLESQLNCLQSTNGSTIAHWFSGLGKAIIKPFKRRVQG